jgi:hypothetical protein
MESASAGANPATGSAWPRAAGVAVRLATKTALQMVAVSQSLEFLLRVFATWPATAFYPHQLRIAAGRIITLGSNAP